MTLRGHLESVSMEEVQSRLCNGDLHPGGGGIHDLWMDGGLSPGFQKGTLF